jgi:regulator of replication initiation timing
MRPVIDDSLAEKVQEITDSEFRLPGGHIKFHQRLTVLLEMFEELSRENEELSRENERLKRELEESQSQQFERSNQSQQFEQSSQF